MSLFSFFFFFFVKMLLSIEVGSAKCYCAPRLGGLVGVEDFGGDNEVSGLNIPEDFGV